MLIIVPCGFEPRSVLDKLPINWAHQDIVHPTVCQGKRVWKGDMNGVCETLLDRLQVIWLQTV